MRAEVVAAALLLLGGCGPSPEAVVEAILTASEEVDLGRLERGLAPRYTDALGDRARVLQDLQTLGNRYPQRRVRARRLERRPLPDTRAAVEVVAELELALDGAAPAVRAEGPMRLLVQRDGVFRVQGGLLVETRDVLDLLGRHRAALEARDLTALSRLLHPSYRARLQRRGELEGRLRAVLVEAEGEASTRLEPVRVHIELREDLVHVDAHLRRISSGTGRLQVHRLTLQRSAGRLRIADGLLSR